MPLTVPTLTVEQGLRMQNALIAQYGRPEFQKMLQEALQQAGDDFKEQTKARQRVCLNVQGPIIAKFGFEPSMKGVAQTIAAFALGNFADDPRVKANNATLAALVSPVPRPESDARTEKVETQAMECEKAEPNKDAPENAGSNKADPKDGPQKAEPQKAEPQPAEPRLAKPQIVEPPNAAPQKAKQAEMPEAEPGQSEREEATPEKGGQAGLESPKPEADDFPGAGQREDAAAAASPVFPPRPSGRRRQWKVTGGVGSGGIEVREGRELGSAAFSAHLATGAEVLELERVFDRLRYRKQSGAGPEMGWVSLSFKGAPQLELVAPPDAPGAASRRGG